MIYYKFLYKPDFLERLNVSKAGFEQIFYPDPHSDESYCFAEIKEEDFDSFIDYFGRDGKMVNPDSGEWPESIQSTASGRDRKFSVIKLGS